MRLMRGDTVCGDQKRTVGPWWYQIMVLFRALSFYSRPDNNLVRILRGDVHLSLVTLHSTIIRSLPRVKIATANCQLFLEKNFLVRSLNIQLIKVMSEIANVVGGP